MAKETIRRLSDDVGRILVAGAHLASADPELRKDREAIDALALQVGDRAPVIARLAEATARALGASGNAAAAELIGLATMAAQVKAAQAAPARVVGDVTPLPAVPAVPTPCGRKDLDDLHSALVERGLERREKILRAARALVGGYIGDLRLAEALIFAMGDMWIGEMVCDKAIPQLGHAIVNPIRQRLRIKGGTSVDGRRLRALVAVQKRDAMDLLEQAMKEGSAEVREAAMDAIADHLRGVPELERYALEALARERSGGVRRAATRVLGGYATGESLEALLTALDSYTTFQAAAEALASSRNPRAVEKLLARLGELVAAEKARPPRGKSSGDAEAEKEDARNLVDVLLNAFSRSQAPAIASAAMELLDKHGPAAAAAVVGSGDKAQLTRIASYLAGTATEMFPAAVLAAVKLGGDEAFKRLSATFKAKDRERKAGIARIEAVTSHLEAHAPELDQRWSTFLLGVLARAPRGVAPSVVTLLGAAREKRALKPILKILAGEKKEHPAVCAIKALGRIGDPSAIAPILEKARSDEQGLQVAIRDAILEINDPSAVDQVRTIYVGLKDPGHWRNWRLGRLLRELEARFPGN